MTLANRPRLVAFLGSCLLYLVPLAGPPSITILAFNLYHHSRLDIAWGLSDLSCALFLQWLLYFLIRWHLHNKSVLSTLGIVVAVPLLFLGAFAAFQRLIPQLFLIEMESASESGSFKQICSNAGYWIESPRTPVANTPESNGFILLAREQSPRYAILRAAGCVLQPLPASVPSSGDAIEFLSPSGAMLFTRPSTYTYWAPQLGTPVDLGEPEQRRNRWILSNDGRFAAWLDTTNASPQLHLKPLPSSSATTTKLNIPAGKWALIEVDAAQGLAWLARDEHELWTVTLSGAPTGRPLTLPDVGLASTTFRRAGSGYVIWDAYREYAAPRILWSHNGAPGRIDIPKGRRIASVSLNPTGTRIAVSTTNAHNFGDVRDSIFVVDLKSGREIYRRFFARARTEAWFVANNVLATAEQFAGKSIVRLLSIEELRSPAPARPSSPSDPSEPVASPSGSGQPTASAALRIDYRRCHACPAL